MYYNTVCSWIAIC